MKNIEHICKLYSSPVTAKSLRKPAEEAFRAGEKYYSLNNAIIQESPREILNIARREIYKIPIRYIRKFKQFADPISPLFSGFLQQDLPMPLI